MALAVLDGNGAARTLKTTLDGSDHVTHNKIDSVAGTVAATQSGTWNVGLTGVTIDGQGRPAVQAVPSGVGVVTDPATAAAPYKRAFANVAASQTDAAVVAAVGGKKIRVLGLALVCGGPVTFNTKPGGAGTAISATFSPSVSGVIVLPETPAGWFETAAGEGLSVTTGAGSTVPIQVIYVEV